MRRMHVQPRTHTFMPVHGDPFLQGLVLEDWRMTSVLTNCHAEKDEWIDAPWSMPQDQHLQVQAEPWTGVSTFQVRGCPPPLAQRGLQEPAGQLEMDLADAAAGPAVAQASKTASGSGEKVQRGKGCILEFSSSSDSEVPQETLQQAKGVKKRNRLQLKKRRSRKKASHILALKPSFWKGLEEGGSERPLQPEARKFVLSEWVAVCQRLFPRTLTALLNGKQPKCPVWLLQRWQPFAELPVQEQSLGSF